MCRAESLSNEGSEPDLAFIVGPTDSPSQQPTPQPSNPPSPSNSTSSSSSKDGAYRSASSAFDASGLSRAVAKLAAFEAYSELLAPKNKQPSLLSAAVLIARHANPDANEAACSAAIDEIVKAVQAELPPKAYPLRIVNTIVKVMYSGKVSGGLGFRGNDTDYSSPSNSDISLVLERRTGEMVNALMPDWMLIVGRIHASALQVSGPA